MKRVWKFVLDPNEEIHRIELPQSSDVLGIQPRDGKIMLWVRFESVYEKPYTIERLFRVAMTGQPFADDDLRTYIGTVQFETVEPSNVGDVLGNYPRRGHIAYHVFEETP